MSIRNMEPLRLKLRKPVEEDIECWDDDADFIVDGDDLSFRTSSAHSNVPQRRRDSTSSHVSLRSDLGSMHGEEKQVHLPGDDETSTQDAIAAAQHAGIPLPKNVPSSALMGGTIKRLGGRRIQKIIHEDWENDLEIPESPKGFEFRSHAQADFPDLLRQVSIGSTHGSPTKPMKLPVTSSSPMHGLSSQVATSALSTAINLEKFRDVDGDDRFFGEDAATIKVTKNRQQIQPIPFITPPTPQKKGDSALEDDFEQDLELPSSGKLKLSTRREIPRTPSQADDLDWGEGSLGTRYGGTRRDGRFNRSSSASALSPSVSSSITAESEDETFDGLILPPGPLDFKQRLQSRKQSPSPSRLPKEPPTALTVAATPQPAPTSTPNQTQADEQDMLDDLDIGDGDVFNSGKLTLHRNIKIKETRTSSPARPKTAISLTFTNKPSAHTRLPRLSHERSHSTSLEPVSESGGPIQQRSRRSQSRLGHVAHSSVTSLPTTTNTSVPFFQPSTPRKREVTTRSSFTTLRNDASTTNAQLLRQKRSLPAVRASNSPVKTTTARPPSRTDATRPHLGTRPKTPVERTRAAESPVASLHRKNSVPFLPAGLPSGQSHSMAPRTLRQFRRYDSETSIDNRPSSRAHSRSAMRSPSPQRIKVAADTWERLSRPKNKRNFGDGHELDGFDDLPTSKESETKYMKQPISSSGPKAALRNKIYQNVLPDRMATPSPISPQSPAKAPGTPRFARDTAASRIARETSLANRAPVSGPLANVTAQRGAQVPARNVPTPQPAPMQSYLRPKKSSRRQPQQKPHLIANLTCGKESKVVNGMYYNADTFCWEGNENALNLFDTPISTQSPGQATAQQPKERETATPRPALITNISATKGVQVVGGMVFDPQNMCWLKLGQTTTKSELGDALDGGDAFDDEDVFRDIPDLDEPAGHEERREGRVSDIKDEWMVGEEFDVGPEFVRRQREEEDRWRRKCEKWVGRGARDQETWRWTIRELVSQFDDLAV